MSREEPPVRLPGQAGFALVITLIITALLVALTAEFVNEVYVDTSAGQNFVHGQQASLLADSGIAGGIKILQLTLATQNYTSLGDRWAGPLQVEDEQGTLQVTIEEESGKLNLNYVVLPNGTLWQPYHSAVSRLLRSLKLPADLLDSVVDWVDENQEPRSGGGESPYYQGLKPPYIAKNGKLDSLEELLLVRGFSAKTVKTLKPFVTIYPDVPNAAAAPVNINTAPREVLISLDDQMSESLADRIVTYRKDTPFRTGADLAKVPGMETAALRLATNITVVGGVYRLTSLARVNETIRVIEAVVRVSPSQSQVLYWREY